MNLLQLTPAPVKRLGVKLLPRRAVVAVQERALRTRTYIPWMVSRENPLQLWFKRKVLKRKPHLFRVIVHLTDHCNLGCKGCTHFSNIAKPAFTSPDDFAREMSQMTEIFSGITEIFLLGGEPLLHPEVNQFIDIARKYFPRARINVMTNGVLIPKMDTSFFETLKRNNAWILCDLYPEGLDVPHIEELCEMHGANLEWTTPRDEFFKLPLDLKGSQDPKHSFENCGGLMNCVVLRNGQLYPCAYCGYSDIFCERFEISGMARTAADSIDIFAAHDPWDVFDFLCNPIPWCRFCDVEHKTPFTWGHSKRMIDEWT